ncbi:ATP-binding cassette domain-containing protein [Alistipes sp. ZOR0009]|uniref:ATP-binding cassette domain-containing protein n=1 Tax=Alistipes sp. ZOR0009 TaxID=1339253 RepID=UPI0006480D84|nr:ATP-binding cassette domain-containing protein [Alistipes sp. ZOR0009]
MSIVVEGITKHYDTQVALNGISFTIPSKQVVGFLGPNGAGKSTMMKILTGYIPATSGIALVDGFDVALNPIEAKQVIGYLPENNPLYYDFYVKEYLEFVGNIYKVPNLKTRVAEVVDMTGIGDEQRKKIGSLSKGYKQRVGLAQALIHDPSVLILDEPTSGLDPNQIVEIRSLIEQIGREKTVMLSTHIMQEVEAICQNIIIIDKGNIVANGPTKEIAGLAQDSKEVVVEFTASLSVEQVALMSAFGKVANPQENVYIVNYSDNVDIRTKLFNFAVENGLVIVQLQQREAHLENVFRTLTGNKQE